MPQIRQLPGLDIIEKRFCFILGSEIAKSLNTREKAVKRRSCLSHIRSTTRGNRYSIRRGSGLFIVYKAFGDASNQITSETPSYAFLVSIRNVGERGRLSAQNVFQANEKTITNRGFGRLRSVGRIGRGPAAGNLGRSELCGCLPT